MVKRPRSVSVQSPFGRPFWRASAFALGGVTFLSAFACSSSDDAGQGSNTNQTGGMGGAGANGTGGTGADATGGTASGGSSASGGTGASAPTWPSGPIRPKRYRVPDPPVATLPCALSGAGTVSSSEVLVGQTHLTPEGWPFQTISADRPLTVAVSASGSGAAPAFVAKALLDGKEFSFCLTGPSTLPADTTDLGTSTYRGSLPAAWVKPGLKLEVSFGSVTKTLTLDVKPANWLTLYLVDAQLFGAGTNDEVTDAQLTEFLAHLPVSYLDVGQSPFGVWKPKHLLVEPRDDGHTPTGATTSHDAIIITENPHCSDADKSAGTCTLHSGYGTMSAVLHALDGFRAANGVESSSTWFADLAVKLGGGLAGGQRGTGDDADLTMNHELGHAWGFPHWAASNTEYPYEGVQRDRGGFGDRWGVDQVANILLSPLCDGKERQSPMQRAGSCVAPGTFYDPYSDYESMRLLRMTLGASTELTGDVPYAGGLGGSPTRPYTLPKEDGREHMVWNTDKAGFELQKYDEATKALLDYQPTRWDRVKDAEVPVVMFSGGVIVDGGSFFEAPVSYVGNVLEKIDPSDGTDYASLYSKRSSDFYWANDLNLRFTLDDGTVFARIVGGGELRAAGDYVAFAYNLPKDVGDKVKKVEVLSRPLGQYDTTSRLSATDSATNYFDSAKVLATWTR